MSDPLHGSRANQARPISSVDDGGTERLAVDAAVTGTSEINLDAANDEVTVYGSDDGGTTRIIVKTDAGGAIQIGDNGTTVSVDDGASSLTVDNAALSVVGGGVEATALRVTLASDGTGVVSVDDNGDSLTVDGSVSISGAVDTELPAAAALSDGMTNPTTPLVGSAASLFGGTGTGWDRAVTAASHNDAIQGRGVQSTHPVLWNGATFDRAPGSTTGAKTIGGLAHDTADTAGNNPQKVGARAVAHGASPTAVAAADVTHLIANRHGVAFTIGGHPNVVSVRANYTAAQTDTALVTIGAGSKAVVTSVMVTADAANTVDPAVRIGFGTANTPTATGVVAAHPGVPAGAGFTRGDGSGILGVGADNEDIRVTCEVPTGGSLDVIVSYYACES